MFGFLAQATYSYTTTTTSTSHFNWGFFAAITLISLIFAAIFVIALWKIFVKAGVSGWKSLIPVYNMWILFEIAGKPGWWALIGLLGVIPFFGTFISIAYLVLCILAALELGKAFGKSTTFSVVGLILFSFVGFLILGFDDSKYVKPSVAGAQGNTGSPDGSKAMAAQSPISTDQQTKQQPQVSSDQPTTPEPPTQTPPQPPAQPTNLV